MQSWAREGGPEATLQPPSHAAQGLQQQGWGGCCCPEDTRLGKVWSLTVGEEVPLPMPSAPLPAEEPQALRARAFPEREKGAPAGGAAAAGAPQFFLLPGCLLLNRLTLLAEAVETDGDSSFTLSSRVFLMAAGEIFS